MLVADDAAETEGVVPSVLPGAVRNRILLYLGVLILLLGFGSPVGGMVDVPITYYLKNRLHLQASEIANFRVLTGIPIYFCAVFGFARDIFNPFGMRDRGFIVIFGAVCAIIYGVFAFVPVSYWTLVAAVVLLTMAFLLVSSAQAGLSASIAQQHVMPGQVSVVWNLFTTVPVLTALILGGLLSDQLEGRQADTAARVIFLVGAATMTAVTLYGLLKPKAVFQNLRSEQSAQIHWTRDLKRLVSHWPIYPALLITMMWNFQPGAQTPLQFYLQNTLHSSDALWAEFMALTGIGFIPTFFLFGALCRKVPLRRLLLWATLLAIPQFLPLLLVQTPAQALMAALVIGLMGGAATAAYLDLVIRSCPPGLQGATLGLSAGMVGLVARLGDVLGTRLYGREGNFTICIIAITIVYALILPVLWLVPKSLVQTKDGQVST